MGSFYVAVNRCTYRIVFLHVLYKPTKSGLMYRLFVLKSGSKCHRLYAAILARISRYVRMSIGDDCGLLRFAYRFLDPKIRSEGGFSRSDELDVDNESAVLARSRPPAKSCLIKCFPDRLRTCAPVVSQTSADRARNRRNSCSVCIDKHGPVYRSGDRESGTSQLVNTWFFK